VLCREGNWESAPPCLVGLWSQGSATLFYLTRRPRETGSPRASLLPRGAISYYLVRIMLCCMHIIWGGDFIMNILLGNTACLLINKCLCDYNLEVHG